MKQRSQQNNSSLALEQVANFIAVSSSGNTEDTICELILRSFIVFPNEKFDSAVGLADGIYSLSSLRLSPDQVEKGTDTLIKDGKLLKFANDSLTVAPNIRADVQERIDVARRLEAKVQQQWLGELTREYPVLNHDAAWVALKDYLCSAFRKHGMQTVALLDPNVDNDLEHSESLSLMLARAVETGFSPDQRAKAQAAISGFLSDVGNHADRSKWIAELADATFHFFCLQVSPEVSKRLRENLSPLKLFLDTNVLFGILNLHVHLHVEVSQLLLTSVIEHRLPFTVYYHEATKAEMGSTISYYGDKLRSKQWSQSLSRAAARTRNLSGIELKYHEQNAVSPISPDAFLRPYEHFDELLKHKKIVIYRTDAGRMEQCAQLYADYQAFLEHRGHDKDPERIKHDVTVLDTVRELRSRSQSKSTLEAGALFITSDFYLFRFDWENSRANKKFGCAVLPSAFWQILRPYIPPGENFDRIFAETFAIPEFRSMGSKAAWACSKMMEILAGYKSIPEELSVRMLSNDVLLNQLRQEPDDDKFRDLVVAELDSEAATLAQENSALKSQIEQMQRESVQTQELQERKTKEWKTTQNQFNASLQQLQTQISELDIVQQKRQQEQDEKEGQHQKQLQDIKETSEKVQAESDETRKEKTRLTQKVEVSNTIAALSISILIISAFELYVYLRPWIWLRDHQNSYGLQVGFALFVLSVFISLARPVWRTVCLGTLALGVVLAALTILGGPKQVEEGIGVKTVLPKH